MRTFIRRKPLRVSLGGLFSLLVFGAAFVFLVDDTNVRFIGLFAGGTFIVILLGWSFLVPFVGGVEVEEGRIETMTGLGGLISFHVDDLDPNRTRLTEEELVLQPKHGEGIRISLAEYSAEDIVWLAHYCGVTVREA